MLGLMEGKLGEHHSGQLRRETSQAKAERIVGEELRRLGWHEGDLTRRPKGDPEKMALAARLRQEWLFPEGWVHCRHACPICSWH